MLPLPVHVLRETSLWVSAWRYVKRAISQYPSPLGTSRQSPGSRISFSHRAPHLAVPEMVYVGFPLEQEPAFVKGLVHAGCVGVLQSPLVSITPDEGGEVGSIPGGCLSGLGSLPVLRQLRHSHVNHLSTGRDNPGSEKPRP